MLNEIETIPNNLLKLINSGENVKVEFKECQDTLPKTLFETICAMLNRNGGHIFLGVNDKGNIIGIPQDKIKGLKKDFANLCNNSQKIYPNVYLEIKEYQYQEKIILYIYVYESSDVHRSTSKIFDRNQDVDYDITNNTSLVANLYIRKSNTYLENKIYPYATMDDLRSDLIDKVRKMATNRVVNHPWATMSDIELLKSASLYEKDYQTGQEGFNLACILLFGKDETISSVLSYYRTDAVLQINDTERYDDRDDIRTNLLESYERLTNFIAKHLNDKFYLENNIRISIRDIIARELCVNLLIHRELSNPYPAKLIITKSSIITENANKPKTIGYIDLNNYASYPKNPKIASVFKEIGLAEEFGSGIKKITKYSKIYGGKEPVFYDDDIFRAEVVYNNDIEINTDSNIYLNDNEKKLYEFIKNNNGVTRKDINDFMHPILNSNDEKEFNNRVRYLITKLKNDNLIENVGSDKYSIWK